MGLYPRRVRVASQLGTALGPASLAHDVNLLRFLRRSPGPMLHPRSIVRWDAGVTTSTADQVLEDV